MRGRHLLLALLVLLACAPAAGAVLPKTQGAEPEETVTVSVGQILRLKTVFDKTTKYTVVTSGVVTLTSPSGGTETYDPFHIYTGSCENAGRGVYLQIKDVHGNVLDDSDANRPPCRADHRYEFQINEASAWDFDGAATTSIPLQPGSGWTASGSFTLTIRVDSTSAPKETTLTAEVALASVSNGCGGGPAGSEPRYGDTSAYWGLDPNDPGTPDAARFVVDFRQACNFHDACYSGAMVRDPFTDKLVDYRPWSQKQCDDRFFTYMRILCLRQITAQAEKRGHREWASRAIDRCYGTGESATKLTNASLGAESRYDFVRSEGAGFYRARADVNGTWVRYTGRPIVAIVKQIGRSITVTWRDATSAACGQYRGLLVSRDQDEIVRPTVTLNGQSATFTLTESGKHPGRFVIEWSGPSGRATLLKGASNLVSGCL